MRAAADSFNEIATVRIELADSDPLIWREVEVPTSITLKTLHAIIQATVGWFDCHLWEFTVAKRRYGLPTDEDWGTEPLRDASKVRLRDVLAPGKTTIDYIYDFGDSWEHRLTITNVRAGDPNLAYPRYVGGERDGRRRIAAASPASTPCSTRRPIQKIRTMPTQKNGSTIATPMNSMSCRSHMRSGGSPANETPQRPDWRRRSRTQAR